MVERKKNYLKVLTTFFLFYLIFKNINFKEIVFLISRANFIYFLLMILIWFPTIYLSTLRWNKILASYNIHITTKKLYLIYLIASFYNNFLPSSIGGDSYKFLRLNTTFNRQKSKILSSIIIERGLGFLSLIFLSLLSTFYNRSLLLKSEVAKLALFLLLALFLTSILFFFIRKKLAKFLSSSTVNLPILKQLKNFVEVFVNFQNNKALIVGFLVSLILSLLTVFSNYLGFLAFGKQIKFSQLLFLVPLVSISSLIPISINSLGVKEGFYIYFFALIGVEKELSLSVSLIGRFLTTIASLSGGILLIERSLRKLLSFDQNN